MSVSPVRKIGPKALIFSLALIGVIGSASFASSADKPAAAKPAPTLKLREVADFPEDYLGQTFTYTVRISTNPMWLQRGGDVFFLFVQDAEGNKLPNRGFTADSTINLIRFVLPKEEGRKLIAQLNATQTYEARIRFTIDRQRGFLNQGWDYLGRISSVEVR